MGTLQPEDTAMRQELDDSGCVQDVPMADNYTGSAHILDLSDDVLLCILRLCCARDLKALGHTCPRLGALVCDHTLWQKVDFRSIPFGIKRMRWLLNNCLSPATQELQISGFVNKDNRCLGIQDLTMTPTAEPEIISSGGPLRTAHGQIDMENFLLRMWYPHLPRYAMSPRWPDKREAAGKAYCQGKDNAKKPPLSPLSQLASEIVAGVTNAGASTSNSNAGASTSSNDASRSSNDAPKSSNDDSKSSDPDSGPSKVVDEAAAKCPGPQFTFSASMIKTLQAKCPNMTTLVMEYCNLDFKTMNIRYFPSALKKLSLKGTRCYNLPINQSYLGKVQDRLPELEYLDISECDWFEPASLMPLSKMPKLQELYMRDCRRLTECVAYASLATRYGFQKLRILDVRGSPVADSEVSAFGWLPLLEELYVSRQESPKSTPEHSHKWEDELAPFNELEPWEADEPEYYKSKPSSVEPMDEDEDPGVEAEPEERMGEDVLGNIMGPMERRIIVIQPNRPNEGHQQPRPVIPAPRPRPQPVPRPEPPRDPPQPGPAKRPNTDNGLDLVKRPRLDNEAEKDGQEPGTSRPDNEELPGPSRPHNGEQHGPSGSNNEQQPIRFRPITDEDDPGSRGLSNGGPNGPCQPNNGPQACSIVYNCGQNGPSRPNDPSAGSSQSNDIPIARPAGPNNQEPRAPTGSKDDDQPPGPDGPNNGDQPDPGPGGPNNGDHPDPGPSRPNNGDQPGPGPGRPNNGDQPGPSSGRPNDGDQPVPGPARPNDGDQPVPGPARPAMRQPYRMREGLFAGLRGPNDDRPLENEEQRLNALALEIHNQYVREEFARLTPERPMARVSVSVRPAAFEPLPQPIPQDLGFGEPQEQPVAENPPNRPPPPVAVHARPLPDRQNPPNVERRQNERPNIERQHLEGFNALLWDRAEGYAERHRFPAFLRGEGQPVINIDIDIHRRQYPQAPPNFAYPLVSDSAILRFGRADNDNINYVHIGQNFNGNEAGARPDRSNLRVLSVTGYRNITDRSLEHLATAAPHIRLIDFSLSGVTSRGVYLFKAIRPNCEVVFSEFGRHT